MTGASLIHYRYRGLLGSSAEVTVLPAAQDVPELPWMVMLGWYLMIMMEDDASAVAAV